MARIAGVLAGAILLPLLFAFSPAKAANAIYFSAPENAYGWCAGYSYSRAHSCARKYCEDAGGTACELALECDGGAGAVALANDPAGGMGAACGLKDQTGARAIALSTCMASAKTLCSTDSAFTRNGSSASEANNRDFDRTYLAQIMLQIRNYDPGDADGRSGPGTRTAVTAFQTDLGRTPDGALDDEIFKRLVDAVGGAQNLARIIKSDLVDKFEPDIKDRSVAVMPTPAPTLAFGDELMARTPEDRLLALATVLSSAKTKCTLPALDATAMSDPKDGNWDITCAEGSYVLMMSEGSRIIMSSGGGKDSTGEGGTPADNAEPGSNGSQPGATTTDNDAAASESDSAQPDDSTTSGDGTQPSDSTTGGDGAQPSNVDSAQPPKKQREDSGGHPPRT